MRRVFCVVLSVLLFALTGCGNAAVTTGEEAPAAEAAALQEDGDSTSSDTSGIMDYYNLPSYVNTDFIYRGTIVAVEKVVSEMVVNGELMGLATNLIITTKVEEVYSGDLFKAGDTAAVFSSDFSSPFCVAEAEVGLEVVLFASDLESKIFTGQTWKEHLLEGEGGYGKYDYFDRTDLYVAVPGFDVFPYSDGLVSAQLVWAEDITPSLELTKEAAVELAEGNRLKPGGYTSGRAYFTNEDFIKALAFYKEKWPPGSSFFVE